MSSYNNSFSLVQPTKVVVMSLEIYEIFYYVKFILYAIICLFFSVFGSLTNVVNMVVFAKMGFQDTINVSLFGLAIADFFSCFSMILGSLSAHGWFVRAILPYDAGSLAGYYGVIPHYMFGKITTTITAFITFERCLCVATPLKVKSIITVKRVMVFVVSAYTVIIASYVPIYLNIKLGWGIHPDTNTSVIRIIFTEQAQRVQAIHFPVFNIMFSFVSFLLIMVCTVILAINLRRKASWRQTVTSEGTSDKASTKETKIVKMVVIIATVFIICFLPSNVVSLMLSADKNNLERVGMRMLNKFCFTLETVNSAINIFIYYFNSSNYNNMFKRIFFRQGKQ